MKELEKLMIIAERNHDIEQIETAREMRHIWEQLEAGEDVASLLFESETWYIDAKDPSQTAEAKRFLTEYAVELASDWER